MSAQAQLESVPETIVGVAIRHVEGDVHRLPAPARHNDVIHAMGARYQHRRAEGHKQGFVTSSGRFVDRWVARQIAERAGQLLPRASGFRELFSEDVW